MKKIVMLILLMIIAGAVVFTPPAFCSELSSDVYLEADKQLDELKLDDFEKIANRYLAEIHANDARGLIESLISGDVDGIGGIFEFLIKDLVQSAADVLSLCLCIIIICVLYNTQGGLLGKNSTLKGIVHFVLLTAVTILVTKRLYEIIEVANGAIDGMTDFMNVLFPILVSLLTLSAGGVGAGIFSPILAILASVITNLISGVVFPIFIICTVLSISGNLTESIKLDTLRNFLKSAVEWMMGIAFGLFSAVSAGAGILTSGVSSSAARLAKTSISGYIPIIGKYLESGIDIVSVGSVLIKNSIGVVSLLIIALIVLIPVIKCVVLSLALSFSAGIVESFADKKVVNVLTGIGSSIKMIVFALLGVGISFFVTVCGVILSIGVA